MYQTMHEERSDWGTQQPQQPTASQQQENQNAIAQHAIAQQNNPLAEQKAVIHAQFQQLQDELCRSKELALREQTGRLALEKQLAELRQPTPQPTASTSAPLPVPSSQSTEINTVRTPLGSLMSANHAGSMGSSMLTLKQYDLPEFPGIQEQLPVFIAAYQQSTEAFGYNALQNTFRLQK